MGGNECKTPPINDPISLWGLQGELLGMAEKTFGLRDTRKKVYQPSWNISGPHIRHSKTKDGAWAELGLNAKYNWKLTLYQLAHETVHLLDQCQEPQTNLLEEGAAVKFSLDMLNLYGFDSVGFPTLHSYLIALNTFNKISLDPYAVSKSCREICGSFLSIDKETLIKVSPEIKADIISELLLHPVMR